MFKPSIIAFDYETALTDGTPSVEYYRDDFRVVSAAFSWFREDGSIKSVYREGEAQVRAFLLKCGDTPLVVHNAQFEIGVSRARFPDVNLNITHDTMRLAQVADNGGKEAQKRQELTIDDELGEAEEDRSKTGLRLQQVTSRWLPAEFHNHKEPYYEYLRERGVKTGKEGENLHLLPPDMLEKYNVADSEVTLRLYNVFTEHFASIGYDTTLDHQLYLSTTAKVAHSKARGVRVDRARLQAYRDVVTGEIAEIGHTFKRRFKAEIDGLEQEALVAYVGSRKSERGQVDAWLRAVEDTSVYEFNVGSTHQLANLFIGKLGMKAMFTTAKGAPAFGKSFLSQWGDGGEMLKKRRTKLIGLKQTEALLELSEYDGRWHCDLKACGTATGRFAGGNSG